MDKSDLKIQALTEDDIGKIVSMQKGFAELNWTYDSFLSEIQNRDSICLKAVFDNQIAGYIFAKIIFQECHIINLFVVRCFRLKGVGSALMNKLFEMIIQRGVKRVFLELRSSNIDAIKLYEKFGFSRIAIRRELYTNPLEDGVFMVKDL